ncbi:DUF397 domain-containing protein [Streptomyces sp. NPDC088812]|uniref:DUF397 domain-containing protein n=1 Tax=Streptomyces sp. NPDC088812 TaxID=3365905 RepID=UPI0037F97FE2
MHETLHWQKSSFSAGADTNCLEIAAATGAIHLRESDTPATLLSPTPAALNALLTAVRDASRRSPSA